jgi:hypothetical protein
VKRVSIVILVMIYRVIKFSSQISWKCLVSTYYNYMSYNFRL